MDSFHQMAIRVALGDKGEVKKKKDKGPEDFDPAWPKIKMIFQSKVKPLFKDFERAIRDEDDNLVEYHFERMMEMMTSLAKGFRMRDFSSKLKILEQKTFD
jgi:hypothetical protein